MRTVAFATEGEEHPFIQPMTRFLRNPEGNLSRIQFAISRELEASIPPSGTQVIDSNNINHAQLLQLRRMLLLLIKRQESALDFPAANDPKNKIAPIEARVKAS
jgi:hypothetical protein